MPPNSESSSQSDGGARLRSSSESGAPAHGTNGTKETTRSDSPTDEETALVRASVKFGNLNDPFTEPVNVPQSVAPTSYRYREGIPVPPRNLNALPQVTPSHNPAHNNINRGNINNNNSNNGALTRYRQSFSSNDARVSAWGPHAGPATFNADVSLQMADSIHRRITTAIQYINISPGCPSDVAHKHSQMLHEISQLVNSTVHDLRRERDRAIEARNAEHEKFKQALYDEGQSREQRDKAQQELKLAMDREELLKQRFDMVNEHLELAKRQVKSVEEDAKAFQEHHAKVTREYKGQDESRYKQIQDLENKLKALRMKNSELATAADVSDGPAVFDDDSAPSPSAPGSSTKEKTGDETPKEKYTLNDGEAAVLLQSLKSSANGHDGTTGKKASSSFIPNPEAPAWSPAEAQSWETREPSTDASATTAAPTPPTHNGAGALVKHDGRSHGVYGANDVRSLLPFPDFHDTDSAFSRHADATMSGASALYGSRSNSVLQAGPLAEPPRFSYTPFMNSNPGDGNGTPGEEIWMPRDPNNGGGVIPRDKDEWDASDVQDAIERLYELTKGYVVNCHKRGPPNVDVSALQAQEPQTWSYLTGLVYDNPNDASSHMRFLMSNDQYTSYVIQRMCVDYLFKKIVAPQVYLGFSSEMDGHLSALQAQISTIAQGNHRNTSRARQRVIEEHARLIRAMVGSEKMKHFRTRVVDRHASMLAHILEPLRSQDVTHEQALKSLRIMVAATWDISTKVWTGGMTLHYVFPDTGSKYAFGTMDALNGRQVARTPELLQFSQCRISLVVTPTLTLRDDRDREYLKTFGIHRAEVLVMK
ncbi:hypothetical protein F5X96DRAFT_693808 [Biscogniauxia mediterranea]|nr:hypothetical protein F5X96DRAFT_693808 [Biscogniauxia mediterranea]